LGDLIELKGFNSNNLKDVETVVKEHKPHVSLDQITKKENNTIETYEGETAFTTTIPTIVDPSKLLSPMEEFLVSLGLRGNIDDYALLLEDKGFFTSDDLLLAEPSLEELDELGIVDEHDRQKVWAWLHPEEVKTNPDPSPDDLTSLFLSTNLDPELEEILRLKTEVETLQQLK